MLLNAILAEAEAFSHRAFLSNSRQPLANFRRVLDRAPSLHIASIGHTGKDESRGERGSNAKRADMDVVVQVSGDSVKTATVEKANDQPEGPLSFRLEPFDFGPDEDRRSVPEEIGHKCLMRRARTRNASETAAAFMTLMSMD